MTKERAFTLAETLITIGIIGIVAALTMPSLIQKNIEKQRVSQLKKAYSALSQAFAMAIEENGDPSYWGMTGMYDESSHYILADIMRKYLKLSVDCVDMSETEAREVCGHVRYIGKNDWIYKNTLFKNGRAVILADGAVVTFRVYSGQCNDINIGCGEIVIDVNGSKYPNQGGYDQFTFFIKKDKIEPLGTKDGFFKFEKACNLAEKRPYPTYSSGNMYACAAWVLYNENQDYLHCNNLSWDDKHSCKN